MRNMLDRVKRWMKNSWVAQHVKMFMLGLGIGMTGALVLPAVAHAQLSPTDTALSNTIDTSIGFWKNRLKEWGRPILGIAIFFGIVGTVYGAATGNKGMMGGMISMIAGAIIGLILINWFLK